MAALKQMAQNDPRADVRHIAAMRLDELSRGLHN
jgi:hypothetical protein